MEYHLVYDVLLDDYHIAWAHLLIGLVLGPAVLVYFWDTRQRLTFFAVAAWLILWNAIGLPGQWHAYSEQAQCREWARTGQYRLVEGPVTDFHPMPRTGHRLESFQVGGVTFKYSDFDVSQGGFNNTAAHGGPIHGGLYVRIAHRDGRILRIAVRAEP